ncbi:unnamed protein product [Linum tenue]|uniref:Peptidase A1 domain-containing protein n=1 Tax=Linum tenue TaxID=586396 RepID=A0AAV0ICS4_9ROSI|nr:unnamed protein product [Linum tenue]
MDSGTELLHLYTEAFDVVKAEVQKLASSVLTEVPPVSPLELCYKGTVDKDATGFPALGLHFVGEAELITDKFGMFVQMDVDTFCLAALRSESLSIVGIMVQQGYNVGFDLRAMKVPSLNLLLTFVLFFIIFSSSITLITSSNDRPTITTRLIHRDSVFSPLYNASETVSSLARRATESSLARHEFLSSSSSDDRLQPEGVQAGLVLATHHNVFYVEFSIGEPPVRQFALMDTGSSLTWVKCLPCRPCLPNSGVTFFDPTKSKTYSPRPCVLATEQLTFMSPAGHGATVALPNVQFGCCSTLTGTEHQDQNFNGLLALGAGPYSLVDGLGSKFSYCVGSVSDRSYAYNRLSIGANAYLTGDATAVLNIKQEAITTMSYKQGVVLDTGAELSFIYTEVFDVLKQEVVKLANPILQQVPAPSPYELCYRGAVDREARGFPAMALQFARGAEVTVDNFGLFKQVTGDVFCFAVLRTGTISIVGMMAQQGYNVGYDLRAREVYLQSMDCQILPDS